MAFAIGHISGCHLNPAVSVGLVVGGRFPASKLLPYIVSQVLGAIAAGLGVDLAIVQARAMAQYVGVVVDDPFDTDPGDDDVVVRVAHDPAREADAMPTVRAFVERPSTGE